MQGSKLGSPPNVFSHWLGRVGPCRDRYKTMNPIIFTIIQIVISILLIGAILLQQRGGGLSQVFGGEGGVYRTRRGIEKGVFWATIILSFLFFLTAFFNIVIR